MILNDEYDAAIERPGSCALAVMWTAQHVCRP